MGPAQDTPAQKAWEQPKQVAEGKGQHLSWCVAGTPRRRHGRPALTGSSLHVQLGQVPRRLCWVPNALYGTRTPLGWDPAGSQEDDNASKALGHQPLHEATLMSFSFEMGGPLGEPLQTPGLPHLLPPFLGRKQGQELHRPSFLSSFWFPGFLFWGAGSEPSGEALWTPSQSGGPGSLRLGDGRGQG